VIVYGAAFISNPSQVEMAQMVMDIECENNLKDLTGGMGLDRKKEAHFVGGWSSSSAQIEKDNVGVEYKSDEAEFGLRDETSHHSTSSESPIGGPGVSVSKAKHKATADGRILGIIVPEKASSSKMREFNRVQYVNGGNGDEGAA